MIISKEVEKILDKIQYLFMIKTPNKLEIEENSLGIIKDICENPIGNIIPAPVQSGT